MGSSKQEILQEGPAQIYYSKIWLTAGSSKEENTAILNYIFQEILAPAGNNYSI